MFPTPKHLASWARAMPGQQHHRRKTPIRHHRWRKSLAPVRTLVECAGAASRQKDSYLAAQFWRLARRIGKKKAALAVGHSDPDHQLAPTTRRHHLHRPRTDWFVRRIDNNTRRRDRLIGELQGMGYRVSLDKAAS